LIEQGGHPRLSILEAAEQVTIERYLKKFRANGGTTTTDFL
jgi:hypothetical protein